ncbi:MAG: NAD(P)/FAD-dependent oxidoreductase [Candidatus Hodarchaeales archaeon]|jgi:NAD(P)H-nitrite reductase large subunit
MDAVIVGNSRAAVEAIKSFRENDQESSLTCISKEKHPAYHRPLIAEYLSGDKSYEDILYSSAEFYQEKNVKLLKGVSAVELDVDQKKIVTDQSHSISFDRLLIVTGSKPAMPPIPGIDLEGVSPFWTLAEARALSERVPNAKQAVVIGAGLVGMSAIHALHERGLSVTVIEMLDRVLSPCLDAKGSSILQRRMDRQGIDLRLNRKVVEIKSKNNANEVSGVVLDDDTEIPCQIAVISAGVRPNLDFLRESPLEIDQGIIVNEFL